MKRIVSGMVLTLLICMLTLTFGIPTVTADEPIWWFDYTTMSVCWRADLAQGHFLVDFDGDHSTAALSSLDGWNAEWGTWYDLEILKRLEYSVLFAQAFRIGELKIGGPTAHINRADWWPDGIATEVFYFWVPKTAPPTDWVVCLQRSNGTNPIPVTSTFWYSEDGGTTWNSFTPLSVSISPTSASVIIGQSVAFTSVVSGGFLPYNYQWYLNGNPVSGATSEIWTFTPTARGTSYIYLKVTDAKGNTTQSETAHITVATIPVGGHSTPVNTNTKAEPITSYLILTIILTVTFTTIKNKTSRKHENDVGS